MDNPLVTFLPGRFTEFVIDNDGSVVLFPGSYDGPVRLWKEGKWSEVNTISTGGPVSDAVELDDGRWLLVSQSLEREVVLHEYAGGACRSIGRLEGLFVNPTLHPARDGTTWVASAMGRAYCLKDGKTLIHEFYPQSMMYPSALSLDVPERGLWFWSHGQHNGDYPSDAPFQVFQDGKWRTVPHGGGTLGGAVLQDSRAVIIGRRSGNMAVLDVDTGEVHELDLPLPRGEHCLFLHRAPTGDLLLISAQPSRYRRAPMYGGWLGTLLAWTDGRVKTLLTGVDFQRKSYDKGRPVADMSEGTFLAAGQSGLLFVSSDLNTVTRFDWRYGIPLPNIDRMRERKGRLFLLDRERGFAIIDSGTLLRMPEPLPSKEWTVVTSAAPPALSPDGSIWYVTATEPPELIHCLEENEEHISMTGSEFRIESIKYLTTDTKNRPWLIGDYTAHRTAFLDNGVWRVFDHREGAYSTVALEEVGNPGYRLGNPSDACYPVFAGDGRVAYRNEFNRVCYFDGETWDAEYNNQKINGHSPEGQPFYREGILTVQAGKSYQQLVAGMWRPASGEVTPPQDQDRGSTRVREIPDSFPGNRTKCTIWVRDNLGTLWIGNSDALWRGMNDTWIPFPVEGTPLKSATGLESVHVDSWGTLWFALGGGDYSRMVRYRPTCDLPGVEWARVPPTDIATGDYACEIRIASSSATNFVRLQLDDGSWQQASATTPLHTIRLEGLSDGTHSIRVSVFDGLLRASKMLEHRLTVKRDYEKEVRQWTALLSSTDLTRREQAARALARIGRSVLPALSALENGADASVRWWILVVREEIERQRQSNASSAAPPATQSPVPVIPIESQVGSQVTDLYLETLDGQTISLSAARGGKPALIYLWATRCPPCTSGMPFLQQVYDGWSDKGMVFLGVDIGESAHSVRLYMAQNSFTLPVAVLSDKKATSYGVTAIPIALFVDKDGVIRRIIRGNLSSKETIESELRKILP